MDKPISLDRLFEKKIFRVPDYQRGYAWQEEHLKAFWEDLVNLSEGKSHYTGVLTLKQVPSGTVAADENEHWMLQSRQYKLFEIVDGQQRLTTFVILIQALADLLRALPDNRGVSDAEIFLNDDITLAMVQERYLYLVKPRGGMFRTYLFGYTTDNPSYAYLRHRILGEEGGGTIDETFYTLNLGNAKTFFAKQWTDLYASAGLDGLAELYQTLTGRFVFNEYVIEDEFDVYVAFETMNNRGKRLSTLELLKNRLIYLTTLYPAAELDEAGRHQLRAEITGAWKEIYRQLGRNKDEPLNDDDFLRGHWILYFQYRRKDGANFASELLDKEFTTKRVHTKVACAVELQPSREQRAESLEAESEDEAEEGNDEDREADAGGTGLESDLTPAEMLHYVHSLKDSAVVWFNTFHPHMAQAMKAEERRWLEALNRIGMAYFRPLVMSVLKNVERLEDRIALYRRIERFIFLAFRMGTIRSNYRDFQFYAAARALDRKEITLAEIMKALDRRIDFYFLEDGSYKPDDFYNFLQRKFKNYYGYYSWKALRYFLYEYELSLLSETRQPKVSWEDLLRSDKDHLSIEHIYPQTPGKEWAEAFKGLSKKLRETHTGSLGNLLLLSSAINSSLQNDGFADKKKVKTDPSGKVLRCGYSNGSHSEIEVARSETWGPAEIRARGLKLLRFLEKRWDIRFRDEADMEKLLFLDLPASPNGSTSE